MIDEIELLDEIEIEDAPVYPLAIDEQQALERCEAVIGQGRETFLQVGAALSEIQQGKLYRTYYSTFEEYCRDRWDIGRGRAYQLMNSSKVASEMSTMVDNPPKNEREAREIAKSAPADRPRVIERATELAGDKPRTAKHIEQAREEIAQPDLPLEFAIVQRRLAAHDHVLSSTWDGVTRRYVVRKDGGSTGVVMTWDAVLSKLERIEAEPDTATELEIKRLCAICGARYCGIPTDLPYPSATRYRIAFADHGGGGDYLADEALSKLRAACAAKEAPAESPPPPPPPSYPANANAYDQQEKADIKLMRAAHDAIEAGDYAGARMFLDQVQVAIYERDQVLHTLVRSEAQRFWTEQTERRTRFSPQAMISLTTWDRALAHIAALLETTN